MKRILLFTLLLIAGTSIGQIVNQFNFTGTLNTNGWSTHSGTAGQFQTATGTLTFPGLATCIGNKATYVAGNGEDVNLSLGTAITGTGYYSFLLNLPNTTGLSSSGEYFTGFATTTGTTGVTVFAPRVFIKTGTVAGSFQLGIQNTTGGTPTPTPNYSGDLTVGTTYFIVVKLDAVQAPIQASLFINPVPGSAQPTAATVTNSAGTSAFATFGSIFLRQAGNATAGTGNIQIDEIRVGTTWASVTPSGGCTSTNNLSVTNCGPYTLNAQTYATSGSYTQTLTNANTAGCDSIINLTLTVKNATTASISATACGTYIAPSGATFTTSGIKMDTITNVANCDSIITINLTMATSVTYYQDSDGDGLGNPAATQNVCVQPIGYVTNANDCNDANAAIGLAQTFYRDFDNDGYGNALITQVACTQPTGYVSNNTDCKDSIANIYPGATEIPNNGIDENCNGSDSIIVAATIAQYQFTGNNCTTSVLNVTAQPTNATFSNYMIAGSTLVCTAVNDVVNYSGWNTSATIDTTQYYGFSIVPDTCYGMNLTQLLFTHRISNSGAGVVIHLRSSLDGYAADFHTITAPTPNTFINEVINLPVAFATVYTPITFKFFATSMGASGATYRHDNVSVKGFINQLGTTTFYADVDGDGFGNATASIVNCVPPVGYVTNNTDCNDADSTEFPGATWVLDNDNDGFGATGSTVTSCTQPNGYISSLAPVDCNDANATIGAAITYYQDADLDGFGNAAITQTACTAPTGYVTNNTDCNDANALVGGANTVFYADADNDTYGDATVSMIACTAPAGYVSNNTDCDDTNPATHPNAVEVCDGFDNNCNGSNDEGLATFTWFIDADSDGLGNPAVTAQNCLQPAGYVGNDNDCDDSDANPNAGETLYYADVDNDTFGDPFDAISTCTPPSGYVANNEDCDDTNNAINPNATDNTGNGIDENCDGVDGNLGIDDAIFANVTIFPNPGKDQVALSFNGDLTGLTCTFIGIDGKEIPATITEQTATSLIFTTASFATGTYLIQLSTGSVVKTIRWIKN
jgi:hypothetical protein